MKTTVALAGILLLMAGCTSYYRITDTDTGRTYLTTSDSFKQMGSNNVVNFKDNITEKNVNLNSYEYREMKEAEYKADLAARQAQVPPSQK